MTYTPEELDAIQFAESVKWKHRRVYLWKVAAAMAAVLLVTGVIFGVWLTHIFTASNDQARSPDTRYASLNCNQAFNGVVRVPPEGYLMPSRCLTILYVEVGAVRVVRPSGATFDIAAKYYSDPIAMDHIYPIDAYTRVMISTSDRLR